MDVLKTYAQRGEPSPDNHIHIPVQKPQKTESEREEKQTLGEIVTGDPHQRSVSGTPDP